MMRDDLADLIYKAIKKAQRKGDLPKTPIPEVLIERPKRAEHGDYATSLPLKMIADINRALKEAEKPKLAPMEVGQRIVRRLEQVPFVGQVDVAPPGFINITLDSSWLARQVEAILDAGEAFGNVNLGQGRRMQVEFGSANPTGPMHVGFGRNLVLGDSIANVLAAAGYDVQREYYVNDAGSQMLKFGESLYVRYCERLGCDGGEIPEGGYHGEYIADWAQEIVDREGDRFLNLPREQAVAEMRDIGLEIAMANIRQDCERIDIHYDNWFSERSLYEEGVFEHVMSLLRQRDHLFMADGAVWFNATALGGDKDEVVIKSNGEPGYLYPTLPITTTSSCSADLSG